MKTKWKRIWSGFLAVMLLLSLMPTALATGDDTEDTKKTLNISHRFQVENTQYSVDKLDIYWETTDPTDPNTETMTVSVSSDGNMTLMKPTQEILEYTDNTKSTVAAKWTISTYSTDWRTYQNFSEDSITLSYQDCVGDDGSAWILYVWTREEVTPHSVTYNLNIAESDSTITNGQLPSDFSVYPVVTYGFDSDSMTQTGAAFSYFTYTVTNESLNNGPAWFKNTTNSFVEDQKFKVGYGYKHSYDVVDFIGRKDTGTTTDYGTKAYSYYELTGWIINGDDSGKLYQMGDSATMGNQDITFIAQWKEIDANTLAPDTTNTALQVPFAKKYSNGTDAQITQKASNGNTWSWSEDTAEKALQLGSDRQVSYRATLIMNSLIAGVNTQNVLANRNITDPVLQTLILL